jgi:hypothetical protein
LKRGRPRQAVSGNTVVEDFASKIYGSRTSRARLWRESGPLELPQGEAQVNKLIATVQADLDQLKADPSKINDDSLFNDANQQSQALGLNECARGWTRRLSTASR